MVTASIEGYSGAEKLAQLGTVESRTAFLEARQALQQVNVQIADLQEQLNLLLDLPACTILELVEPPPTRCARRLRRGCDPTRQGGQP